jgi:hypothetical protein
MAADAAKQLMPIALFDAVQVRPTFRIMYWCRNNFKAVILAVLLAELAAARKMSRLLNIWVAVSLC